MSLRPLLVAGSSLVVLLVACGGGVATIGNSSGDGSSGSGGSSGTSGSSGGGSSGGTSGSSGTSGGTTCSTNVLPGKRACVPGTARAGAPISVTVDTDEGCLGCFTSYGPCQVNVVGMDITIAMMTITCDGGGMACPAICQLPRTTCQIPPLAAGTYNVLVTGEPQSNSGSRTLVVTGDATATSCTLPPEGSKPPALDASKYSTSCSSDTDCIAVVTGDMCGPCSCPNTAIAASASASYDADARAARSQCIWNGGPTACGACFAAMPRCITSPDALTGMCSLGGIK